VKNVVVFSVLCCILITAMLLGAHRGNRQPAAQSIQQTDGIPSIGRIQILNGCGAVGAANKVADYLRAKGFDVKNKGNAPTSNYPFTMVVSRTKDMSIARQVAAALTTDKAILIRTTDETYDATVFIGSDFPERIMRK
jgi:hypothetical protein